MYRLKPTLINDTTNQEQGVLKTRRVINFVIFTALISLLIIISTYHAYKIRWTCDDIFITFRYVENYLQGKGLVFNEGERVEGYTHFLWLMLIAAFNKIGKFNPVNITYALGLLSYLGTLIIFTLLSLKVIHKSIPFIPYTFLALALNYDFRIWATSGLETSFFTFLLSLTFAIFCLQKSGNLKNILLGFLLVLVMMTRPDGILFWFLGCLFLIADSLLYQFPIRKILKNLSLYLIPFLLIYLPYFIWKYTYYGYIFPNTYYAKSGGHSYWSQGFYYAILYFRSYFTSCLFLLSLAAMVVLFLQTRKNKSLIVPLQKLFQDSFFSSTFIAFSFLIAYLFLFVIRVGGDFMFARFLIPLIPFIYYSTEASIKILLMNHKKIAFAILLILPISLLYERSNRDTVLKTDYYGMATYKLGELSGGILDEYYFWTKLNNIKGQVYQGLWLKPYFKDLDATILLVAQDCMGYYGQFKTCIEYAGLTDSHIAHLPLKERGRIGHEKLAPLSYLQQRGTDFVFERKINLNRLPFHLVQIHIKEELTLKGELITYDTKLIKELHQRLGNNFIYVDFEKYLDDYIANKMPFLNAIEVKKDYEIFNDFYFSHNQDNTRQQAILHFLKSIKP